MSFLALVWPLILKKENSELNLMNSAQNIDLVSHTARAKGLENIYKHLLMCWYQIFKILSALIAYQAYFSFKWLILTTICLGLLYA